MIHRDRSRQPTLRRRLIVQLFLLMAGTMIVALTAITGLARMHEDNGLAIRGYRQLREAFEVGFHLSQAQSALRTPALGAGEVRRSLELASLKLREAKDWLEATDASRVELDHDIASAAGFLRIDDRGRADARMSSGIGRLAEMSTSVRTTIVASQAAAATDRAVTTALVAIVSALVVLSGVVVAVRQYRSVMRPLDRIGDGLRGLARGELSRRIDETGDREFVHLSRDFNRMAGQLQSLCDDLSQQVEMKSRELIRSERLASVGYLAAGVAHEINNPLAIIAGYAERSLARVRDGAPDPSVARQLERSLQIVCDEAFRCKTITDRLLSLARQTERHVASDPADVAAVARDVIDNLAGLSGKPGVRVRLACDSDCDLHARAGADEVKQVVLNLVLNALAATRDDGHVDVSVRRVDDRVELSVADDGAGMTAQTLERAFEPFFSDASGKGGSRGTGLGLSIAHAIVTDRGGTIRAESDGPGRGSRFTVSLPAADVGVATEAEVPHAAA